MLCKMQEKNEKKNVAKQEKMHTSLAERDHTWVFRIFRIFREPAGGLATVVTGYERRSEGRGLL